MSSISVLWVSFVYGHGRLVEVNQNSAQSVQYWTWKVVPRVLKKPVHDAWKKKIEKIENHLSYRLGTSRQLYLPAAKVPSLWSPLNTAQLSSPCSWSSRPAPSRRNASLSVMDLSNHFNVFDDLPTCFTWRCRYMLAWKNGTASDSRTANRFPEAVSTLTILRPLTSIRL